MLFRSFSLKYGTHPSRMIKRSLFSNFFSLKFGNIDRLQIVKYPDPRLRRENELVTAFDEDLRVLVNKMLDAMYEYDGVGLAAPQVGINKRIMVFNEHGERDRTESEMVLINPLITSKSEEEISTNEGCLSFPDLEGRVPRASWIDVDFHDLDGVKTNRRFSDFVSIVFQHEYDHLDKVLFIDKMVPSDRKKIRHKLRRMVNDFGEGAAP